MSEAIGIVGLGRMGLAAARKYMREGYKVVGDDQQPEVNEAFRSAGGIAAERRYALTRRLGPDVQRRRFGHR